MECKKINKWLKCTILIGVCLISHSACASNNESDPENEVVQIEMKEKSYIVSQDIFPNPERGFYRHLGQPIGELNEQELKAILATNISLILRVYYLEDFREKALSREVLDNLEKEFNVIRNAGVKLLLRFAYSRNDKEPDAPLSTIEMHLDQLEPLLKKHKDIIALMQAGLIGAWGEWYYTSNNLNTAEARKAVLDKILKVLPQDRFVQVRTPGYKRQYTGITTPLKASEAFTTAPTARIGHHNDCFMASIDDYGTYEDVLADKDFLEVEGLYLPMGGETCPPSGVDPADCQKAQSEMRKLRWSYLNQDYYRGVNDQWAVEGCMDNIIREMGYRLTLRKAKHSDKHTPGSALFLNMDIDNLGYAPPYNARKVEVVLISRDGKETYKALLDEDPRRWTPEVLQNIRTEITLPADIKPGAYSLYLSLPDPEPTLYNRPEYAIRLANKDAWQPATGYNDMQIEIDIEANLDLPPGKSTLRFTKQ